MYVYAYIQTRGATYHMSIDYSGRAFSLLGKLPFFHCCVLITSLTEESYYDLCNLITDRSKS